MQCLLSLFQTRGTNTIDAFNNDVVVVCATNRPDVLDPALCRPGRLDSIIYVPPPDLESRIQILRCSTKNMQLDPSLDLTFLAEQTQLFSGADLEHLCREAALEALSTRGFESQYVEIGDFEVVLQNIKSSIDADMIRQYDEFKRS